MSNESLAGAPQKNPFESKNPRMEYEKKWLSGRLKGVEAVVAKSADRFDYESDIVMDREQPSKADVLVHKAYATARKLLVSADELRAQDGDLIKMEIHTPFILSNKDPDNFNCLLDGRLEIEAQSGKQPRLSIKAVELKKISKKDLEKGIKAISKIVGSWLERVDGSLDLEQELKMLKMNEIAGFAEKAEEVYAELKIVYLERWEAVNDLTSIKELEQALVVSKADVRMTVGEMLVRLPNQLRGIFSDCPKQDLAIEAVETKLLEARNAYYRLDEFRNRLHGFINQFAYKFLGKDQVGVVFDLEREIHRGDIPITENIFCRKFNNGYQINLGIGDDYTVGFHGSEDEEEEPAKDPKYQSFIRAGNSIEDDSRIAAEIIKDVQAQYPELAIRNNVQCHGSYHEQFQSWTMDVKDNSVLAQAKRLGIKEDELMVGLTQKLRERFQAFASVKLPVKESSKRGALRR